MSTEVWNVAEENLATARSHHATILENMEVKDRKGKKRYRRVDSAISQNHQRPGNGTQHSH